DMSEPVGLEHTAQWGGQHPVAVPPADRAALFVDHPRLQGTTAGGDPLQLVSGPARICDPGLIGGIVSFIHPIFRCESERFDCSGAPTRTVDRAAATGPVDD